LPFLLHFVNVFAAAVVAGGLVAVLLVIVPVKQALPHRLSVEIHLAMLGHQIDRYMKPAGLVAAITGLVLLAMMPERSPLRVAPQVVGLLGMIGVVITSRYYNVPSNRRMAEWDLNALPPGYAEWRARWDRIHVVRTTSGLVALAGYLASALTR